MTERIIRHQPRPKDEDPIGKPISPERLAELYPDDPDRENLVFWTFVRDLREKDWSKFCVSRAPFRFSRDFEIRFFVIGKVKGRQEAPEIIYLGQGKAPNTTEIGCQFAAETWGFAVLKLSGRKK